jgi:DegV family protein with EDD domain
MCALRLVVDDGCEVPAEWVARYGITVVPLVVRFGDEVHEKGELAIDEFWTKARTVAHPSTSQPASGLFQQVFQALTAQGDDVLCITITSKHSGTYNSAWLAAQAFPGRVTVFDSLSVSWGSGFLVLCAARAIEAGMALQQILAKLTSWQRNIQFPILLNTIEDIRRGGRADRLIPLFERVLRVFDIKPVITFIDGELKILGTVRSYERGLARLLELMKARAPYQELSVFHTRQPDVALTFADRLAQHVQFPRERIGVSEVGPVLATHAGARAVAGMGVPAGF